MKKLVISIDMGAKYNGVFVVKTQNGKIIDKKAFTVVIDEKKINFSKKNRRENRHRIRSITRRKLAKRLLWNILDNYFNRKLENREIEKINGLLNRRGYTFLGLDDVPEELNAFTLDFLNTYFEALKDVNSISDIEEIIGRIENEAILLDFLNTLADETQKYYKMKKSEFPEEFRGEYKIIKQDLKFLKEFFQSFINEIESGSKPRKRYLQEIKEEIEKFDFIKNSKEFYNLVGNISNFQLRVLRKLLNSKKNALDIVKRYFRAFHYRTEDEKLRYRNLLEVLNGVENLEEFLIKCDPLFTIPPFEDMNNRNTYKCNSMLVKNKIAEDLKEIIDKLLKTEEFSFLNKEGISYSQKIQRFMDVNSKMIKKEIHPRGVFKYGRGDCLWYKNLLGDDYLKFKEFAEKYYTAEDLIISGIDDEMIFQKCNSNTPYKNNVKHLLLSPVYAYEFSKEEADEFLEKIKNSRGLKRALQRVSETAKKYQNGFYQILDGCFEDKECISDNEILFIIKNIDKNLEDMKKILSGKNTVLKDFEKIEFENLKRFVNILKQTYDILFNDLHGFNRTCKKCTIENSKRSNENSPSAKRLLSDVAKPIDGMLDMMLDRIAWEIVKEIRDFDEVDTVEILLEQNRFEFEEGLYKIKSKKLEPRISTPLEPLICPYTGKSFVKGEYDHILPQSKGVYNSKANLIYASIEGNRLKGNKTYKLEDLHKKHLKAVFGYDDIDKIKKFIKENIPKKENFTNFQNLKLKEQIALRYALFMKDTQEYKKAFEIIRLDKIKNITNGTQKRLARLIQEKIQKLNNKKIAFSSKVIDSALVSAIRLDLSVDKSTGEVNELFKTDIQDLHSHAIDAMTVFYVANSKIKKDTGEMEFIYDFFKDIYSKSYEVPVRKKTLKERVAKNLKIDSLGSVEILFRENMLKNRYFDIFIKEGKFHFGESKKTTLEFKGFNEEMLDYFIKNGIIYQFHNSYRIDKNNLYGFLFDKKDEVLKSFRYFKKLDELRFTTQKKSVISIIEKFFNPVSNDEKKFMKNLLGKNKIDSRDDFTYENLLSFIKKGSKCEHNKLPLKLVKPWEIILKEIVNNKDKFLTEAQKADKRLLTYDKIKLIEVIKNSSVFKITHKRNRKIKNEYSLPLKDTTDKPFLLRRRDFNSNIIYQTVFAKNSARGFVGDYFIHDGHKNIIPLKMEDYKRAYETHNNK